jgi:DNA-binding HxlR family transcriptional regulator
MNADSTLPQARIRAGGTILSLLAGPLCVPILRAHLDGPLRLPDLRERLGGAAQTTLRGQIGNLRDIGALERYVRSGMPYTVENELTDVGHGILAVAGTVEAWLLRAPHGPIPLGGELAKGAMRALIAGWDSTLLRALAVRPLSLTELDNVISEVSYPSLERRLSAMRAARQVEMLPDGGVAKPYTVTEWTRLAVAPLVAAGRCECEHMAEATDPLTRLDVEAAFLLAAPLATLPATAGGSCGLAIGTDDDGVDFERLVGVEVEVEAGEVTSCTTSIDSEVRTWAKGPVDAWTTAILEGDSDGLELGGAEPDLAGALIESLYVAFR